MGNMNSVYTNDYTPIINFTGGIVSLDTGLLEEGSGLWCRGGDIDFEKNW
jgi:hypothetical protein